MPRNRTRITLTRFAAALLVGCLFFATGCKTSQDAAAAATQMSATAKALCDYYTALNTVLTNTNQLYILNEPLASKPYTQLNRDLLKKNQAELAKRAALASDLSTLAASFAQLSGSTASADVSASAIKLQTEVAGLTSFTPSSGEQSILKDAIGLFITAIQEHKEREAARAMDSVVKALTALFIKETPIWSSVNEVYIQVAGNLASSLVDQGAIDNSGLLKTPLDPFGLTPLPFTADINTKLVPIAKQQIEARQDAFLKSSAQATDCMTKSLQEMSDRIHLVATDKPMSFRAPPLTVANVEQWTAHILTY